MIVPLRFFKNQSRVLPLAGKSQSDLAKAVSATTLTVSDDPVTVGQRLTLTARVGITGGRIPTGSVQFSVNGSPIGSAVPLVDGIASLNTTAPAVSNNGHFAATATYSGDRNSLPGKHSLEVNLFDFSARDDTTGNLLFLSANGAYLFRHCADDSSLVLKGNGTASSSTGGVVLEHIAADRVLIAEVNTCNHTAAATVVYKGVTYSLTDSDMSDKTNTCESVTSFSALG
jgi:hypothetical protein